MNDRYEKLLRGVTLYIIYTAYNEGLTDPMNPRTINRMVLETSLSTRGMMPQGNDMPRCLEWLEGAKYITVEWGMDNRREYDSVTLTQEGLNLVQDRRAREREPGLTLPPRR